jgi:hypothetical protein
MMPVRPVPSGMIPAQPPFGNVPSLKDRVKVIFIARRAASGKTIS